MSLLKRVIFIDAPLPRESFRAAQSVPYSRTDMQIPPQFFIIKYICSIFPMLSGFELAGLNTKFVRSI